MSKATPLGEELKRLISRYGAKAVRKEAERLCKSKAGRKAERDWPRMMDAVEQDARDWLDGRDPIKLRSSYSIAEDFARRHRGHSHSATHRRIMGKLSKGRSRAFRIQAFWISEQEQPFADFFRVADEVAQYAPTLAQLADLHMGKLERYRKIFGEPQQTMTIKEIAEKADSRPRNVLAKIFQHGRDKIPGD